ncbi:MAG: hypothetical protein WAU81_12150 [Candidatus Aminicenantales bacterium]
MRNFIIPRTRQLTALFSLLALTMFLAFCSKSRQGPERIIQNGVEIVVNETEPYASQNGAYSVSPHEEFRIDLADEMYAKLGLSDIWNIDINSRRQIFLFCRPTGDSPLVFKFDESGRFLGSFLRCGQGPGEVQYPRYEGVTTRSEILIFDTGRSELFFFDEEGSLLRAIDFPTDLHPIGRPDIVPLENGNYLIQYWRLGPELEIHGLVVGVFDPNFKKVKDLVEYALPDSPEKIANPFVTFPLSGHSLDAIYIGFINKDTEVSVYDLKGELKRVIRKRSSPVEIPPEFERDLLKRLPENHALRKNLKLPRYFPASQYLFADDVGHLFVATYEKDNVTGQNICDVYAPDGAFIERVPLGYFDILKWWWLGQSRDVVARIGRMLCIREKEDGFREIIVYSLRWT